jgi:hypothetical protein
VEKSGEPSLLLPSSEQFAVDGVESQGVALGERGKRDITAAHGAWPPPAVWTGISPG